MLLRIAYIVFLASLLACSGRSVDENQPVELSASVAVTLDAPEEELYKTAKQLFEKRVYTIAIDVLNSLINNYPSGQYLEFAKIKLADSYFYTREYQLSANIAEDFVNKFPGSESAAYMYFLAARSNQLLYAGLGRDTAPLKKAQEIYSELSEKHPGSVYANTAGQEIVKINQQIANNFDALIAYYKKRGNEKAVEYRQAQYDEFLNDNSTISDLEAFQVVEGVAPEESEGLSLVKDLSEITVDQKDRIFAADEVFVSSVSCRKIPNKSVFISLMNYDVKSLRERLASLVSKDNDSTLLIDLNLNKFSQKETFDCFSDQDVKVMPQGRISFEAEEQFRTMVLDNPLRLVLVSEEN